MITTVKELRNLTGLTQKEFGAKYNIPVKTIQNWESEKGVQSRRECPSYVAILLAKAVKNDYPTVKFKDPIDNLMISNKLCLDSRREKALRQAIEKIKASPLCTYVIDLVLYGSTARNEAKSSSDIDLLLVLNSDIKKENNYGSWTILLKGNISSDDYYDPEVDLHIAYGNDWKTSDNIYEINIQNEGVSIWN